MSLRQISTIRKMPVLDLETGTVLGRAESWVVKAKEQRLAAFLLNKTGPFRAALVIVPADIVEYGPDMIVARDGNSVISPQEVVGLPELITHKHTLVGFRAETEDKTRLGTVSDFVFDTVNSEIKTYYICPSGAAGIIGHDKIIPAEQVLQIQPGKIIFSNDVVKPKAKSVKKTAPVYRV